MSTKSNKPVEIEVENDEPVLQAHQVAKIYGLFKEQRRQERELFTLRRALRDALDTGDGPEAVRANALIHVHEQMLEFVKKAISDNYSEIYPRYALSISETYRAIEAQLNNEKEYEARDPRFTNPEYAHMY
jgi:hypothetical protein